MLAEGNGRWLLLGSFRRAVGSSPEEGPNASRTGFDTTTRVAQWVGDARGRREMGSVRRRWRITGVVAGAIALAGSGQDR